MSQQRKGTKKSTKKKKTKKKKRSTHLDIDHSDIDPPAALIETPPNPLDGKKMMHSTRDWSSLPMDIVYNILSYLDVTKEPIFCSLHKEWRAATLPSPFQYSCLRPWLVYYNRAKDSWRFINPFRRMQYDLPVPSELRGCKIRCCSTNGYLLVETQGKNLCLCNPLTGEIVRLPKTPEPSIMEEFCGFCPISFDFDNRAVVGLYYRKSGSYIGIWKLGEQEWEMHTVQQASFFYQLKGSMVSHKGKFYCVGADGGLAVFSTRNIEQSWTVWDISIERHGPYYLYAASYLVKSNGGLLGVFECYDGNVELYRLNERKRAWEQVKNVGRNQMLFLSYGSCFSKVSDVKGLCNSIYFPKFTRANDSSSYMFYSASTKTFSSLDGEFSTMNAGQLRDIRNSCWFVPVPATR